MEFLFLFYYRVHPQLTHCVGSSQREIGVTPCCRVDRLVHLLQAPLLHRHQHPPLVTEVEADLVVGLEGCQQFVKSIVKVRLFTFKQTIKYDRSMENISLVDLLC